MSSRMSHVERQRASASLGGPLRDRRRSTRIFDASSHSAPSSRRPDAFSSLSAVSRSLRRVMTTNSPPASIPGTVCSWRPRLALREHVDLPVLVGEPDGGHLPLAVAVDADPDDVGLLQPFLDALVEPSPERPARRRAPRSRPAPAHRRRRRPRTCPSRRTRPRRPDPPRLSGRTCHASGDTPAPSETPSAPTGRTAAPPPGRCPPGSSMRGRGRTADAGPGCPVR